MPRVFRRLLRPRFLLLVFCIFSFFDFIRILHIHSRIATEYADRERPRAPPKERIYIASTHWNNGAILKSHWNNAVLDLVDVFGADNIFVSVFESGSWDDSKAVLKDLDRQLEEKGVTNRRVEVSDVTHKDEMEKTPAQGWIEKPAGKWNVRRIPYLANLRNKTIKDLIDLHAKGITFDKVLFLNDVVFTTEDVIALLETNRGRYAAACSLDFSKPPMYYDTFALRDTNGEKSVTQSWPYFRSRASRNAMLRHEPVPVASCWNGIVAMPTKPFTSSNLRFRGVPDSLAKHHVEGSECCLIHADNPLSRTEGVYLNPKVRVGYSGAAYTATHGRPWMTVGQIWSGLWKNRLRRWFVFNFDNRVAWSRVKKWMKEDAKNEEKGVECLINEMQVLVTNGWAHI